MNKNLFVFRNNEHRSSFQKMRTLLSEEERFDKRKLSLLYLIAAKNSLTNQVTEWLNNKDDLTNLPVHSLKDPDMEFIKMGWSFIKGIEDISIEQLANLSDEEYWLLINATKLFRVGLSKGYLEQHETLYLK